MAIELNGRRVSRTAAARSDAGILKETQIIAVWGKRLFSSNLIVLLSLNRGISMTTDSLISDLSGKSNFISPTGVPSSLFFRERLWTNKTPVAFLQKRQRQVLQNTQSLQQWKHLLWYFWVISSVMFTSAAVI